MHLGLGRPCCQCRSINRAAIGEFRVAPSRNSPIDRSELVREECIMRLVIASHAAVRRFLGEFSQVGAPPQPRAPRLLIGNAG
jgi:hypothetical protein